VIFLNKKFPIVAIIYTSAINSAIIAPKIQSPIAVVYDCDYDMVLFSKKGDHKIHPASTTKIATLLYALKCSRDLKELLMVVPELLKTMTKEQKIANNYSIVPYLLEPDAYTLGLYPNSFYTLEDLYYALMLVSANDAANVIAYHLGERSIEQFMIGLNRYMGQIGCMDTTYVNPSGLEYPSHRTTAIDLSKMLAYAIKQPEALKILSTVHFKIESGELLDRELNNSNRLIRPDSGMQYKYCIGGKTGYTEHAGYCFVAAAKNGERSLVVAVMQSTSPHERFLDATNLFNAAFDEKKISRVFFNAQDPCFQTTPKYATKPLRLHLDEDLRVETFESILENMEPVITLFESALPVKKGDVLGKVEIVTKNGKVVDSKKLFASEDRALTWISFWVRYKWSVVCALIFLSWSARWVHRKYRTSRASLISIAQKPDNKP
jgi:D-alanyl-D-alanine carboxypeptidase (penicillin-binding protein 5/6)